MAAVLLPPYVLQALALTPATLAAIAGRLSPARLDARLDPERFTPREVLAHLVDCEELFQTRMKAAVAEPGAEVALFDEVAAAIERRYSQQDAAGNLARFATARAATLEWIASLAPGQLEAAYTHPQRGPVTVRDTAIMGLGHDLYHIEQLSSYLAEQTAGTW